MPGPANKDGAIFFDPSMRDELSVGIPLDADSKDRRAALSRQEHVNGQRLGEAGADRRKACTGCFDCPNRPIPGSVVAFTPGLTAGSRESGEQSPQCCEGQNAQPQSNRREQTRGLNYERDVSDELQDPREPLHW